MIRAADLQSSFTNMERGLDMYYHIPIAKNRETRNSKCNLGKDIAIANRIGPGEVDVLTSISR